MRVAIVLLQATTAQGALSADWALVVMTSVVGVLLLTMGTMVASHFITTLKEMRKQLSAVHVRQDFLEDKQAKTNLDVQLLKRDVDPNRIGELIYAKIKAASGNKI